MSIVILKDSISLWVLFICCRTQAAENETILLPPLEKLKIKKKQLKFSKKNESKVATKSIKSNKVVKWTILYWMMY